MNKKLLYEISIIRPLIIFLLVVYHSLCVFTGGWSPPEGVPANAVYWWLGRLISGFRIETIAFVGGYVFCYQCVELQRRQGLLPFAWKKFKRLIVPCFIFGIIYFLLYRFNPARFSWNVAFWRVANGVGHLWFLPMLFWCFLACWLLDRLLAGLSSRWPRAATWVGWTLLLALAGMSLMRVAGLRMGLSRAPYFLFYFYLGYWLRYVLAHGDEPISAGGRGLFRGRAALWALLLWGCYLVLLLLHLQATHLRLPGMAFDCPHWLRGCSQLQIHLMGLGHTCCGILALYLSTMAWLSHLSADAQPGPFLRQCSRQCYGVYVLHMFFMQYVYFYTPFPQWCCASGAGEWLMPWAVLAVTLALSVVGTTLLLKTRFGRFLIG